MPKQMTSALSLIGEPVTNPRGERLGRLDDVFLDPVSGRIAFAVLASGGFGRAERGLRAVPWEALRVERMTGDEGDSMLVLDVEPDEADTPVFARGDHPDFSDPEFLVELRRRYGLN